MKMNKNRKGQAALVMIVIMAMAFIFYSIELNWGRIADLKITTWMAAHSAASQMASQFASYSEKLLHEYLLIKHPNDKFDYYPDPEYTFDGYPFEHGDLESYTVCQGDYLLLRIIVAIIIIVIVALSEGTLWYLAVIILTVLFAVSFILEYAVILPMEQALWNKLMKNMQPVDQFREAGVQTGILELATDSVNIPDRLDMNVNSKWGFNLDSHPEPYQPNDTVSRLSFFYTERLKHLEAQDIYPDAAYQDFLNTLGSFTGTTNVGGNATVNGLLTSSTSINADLFCNASETRYATKSEFTYAGLSDPNGIFDTLISKGWAVIATISPNTPQAHQDPNMIQLQADFFSPDIVAEISQLFGADGPVVLAVLQNNQKSNHNPICEPVCSHDARIKDHGYGLGWTYGNLASAGNKRYVPDECMACIPAGYDPSTGLCNAGYNPRTGLNDNDQCNSPCPNFNMAGMDPNDYRLMYNPFLVSPIPTNALNPADKGYSWVARFGHDDELGKENGAVPYKVKNSSGLVFPMLDLMDHLQDAPRLGELALAGANNYDGQANITITSVSINTADPSGGQDLNTNNSTGGIIINGNMFLANYDLLDGADKNAVGGNSTIQSNLNIMTSNQGEAQFDVLKSTAQQLCSASTSQAHSAQVQQTSLQQQAATKHSQATQCYNNCCDDDGDCNCGGCDQLEAQAQELDARAQKVGTVKGNLNSLKNSSCGAFTNMGSTNCMSQCSAYVANSPDYNNCISNCQAPTTGYTYSNPEIGAAAGGIPSISDAVLQMDNHKALPGNCAYYADSSGPGPERKGGIYWKKGADRYCSGTVRQYLKRDPDTGEIATEETIMNKYYPGSLYTSQGSTPVRHWPYEDCTYMHNSGAADPVAQIDCPEGAASEWPQDRLDAMVYGLPALIGLNQALQGLTGEQLNMGINQWYPQVARFIAPKCTANACAQLQSRYNYNNSNGDAVMTQTCNDLCDGHSCQGINDNPVIKNLVAQFGDNPATCNPQFQGYVLQWWYDLQNWTKATYHWLYDQNSGGMCTGPLVRGDPGSSVPTPGYFKLNGEGSHPPTPAAPTTAANPEPYVVDCLYQKSYFYKELDDCWFGTMASNNPNTNEPLSSPFPIPVNNENIGTVYPFMSYACKKVIRLAQMYPVNFVTSDVPKSLPIISPSLSNVELANLDYPPAPYGEEGNGSTAQTYNKIRAWAETNQVAAVATKARYGQLAELSSKAIDAMNLFNEGAADFFGFINPHVTNQPISTGDPAHGAVYELMGTRAANGITNTIEKLPRLPGYVIYGWQDGFNEAKKIRANGVESPTGRWHLARMEVHQQNDLPTIDAHSEWGWHGFSGPHYNCYTAKNIRGDVWTRATRWDAPAGEMANFGNKSIPIWGFTFLDLTKRNKSGSLSLLDQCPSEYLRGHPSLIDSDPGQFLNQYCRGKNIGRTEDSVDAYKITAQSSKSAVWRMPEGTNYDPLTNKSDGTLSASDDAIRGGSPSDRPASAIREEYFNLNDAFMFNYNPFDEEGTGQYVDVSDEAKNCYCIANYLLANQGIMSYSGAHFAIPKKLTEKFFDKGARFNWHEEIKFNELQDSKSQGDIFPENGDTMPDDLSTTDDDE